MKVADVQKLAVGTKVYYLDFDVSAGGTSHVKIREGQIRLDVVSGGKHRFPAIQWRTGQWHSFNPRHCFLTEEEARQEGIRRIHATIDSLRDTLLDLTTNMAGK